MASAKDIVVKPISARAANDLVKRVHYSGKIVQNSSLHLGAFLNDKLEGVRSFGSPMDKKRGKQATTGDHPVSGGAAPTATLQLSGGENA